MINVKFVDMQYQYLFCTLLFNFKYINVDIGHQKPPISRLKMMLRSFNRSIEHISMNDVILNISSNPKFLSVKNFNDERAKVLCFVCVAAYAFLRSKFSIEGQLIHSAI